MVDRRGPTRRSCSSRYLRSWRPGANPRRNGRPPVRRFPARRRKGPRGLSPELAVTALEDYVGCPRRYYYGEALGLSRRLADTPYLRFHNVIRAGLDWLRGEPARSAADVAVHLATSWTERGPTDHPAATHCGRTAQRMLVNAGAAMTGEALAAERRLTIEDVTITARADHIRTVGGGIVIQRVKAGRLAKSGETPKARYALLQAMVKRDEGVAASFLHISLLDSSQKDATVAAGKLTEAVDEAAMSLHARHRTQLPGSRC